MEVTEAAAADPAKRKELYFEAEKILAEDEPIVIPKYHDVSVYLSKPYLARSNPVLGVPHIERLYGALYALLRFFVEFQRAWLRSLFDAAMIGAGFLKKEAQT